MELTLKQQEIYGWMKIVLIHAPHPLEDRTIIIGKCQDKLWAAVFTPRGDTIRIISVRRARKREASLYEKENIG